MKKTFDIELTNIDYHTLYLRVVGNRRLGLKIYVKDTYAETIEYARSSMRTLEHAREATCSGLPPTSLKFLRNFSTYLAFKYPLFFSDYSEVVLNTTPLASIDSCVKHVRLKYARAPSAELLKELLCAYTLRVIYDEYLYVYLEEGVKE